MQREATSRYKMKSVKLIVKSTKCNWNGHVNLQYSMATRRLSSINQTVSSIPSTQLSGIHYPIQFLRLPSTLNPPAKLFENKSKCSPNLYEYQGQLDEKCKILKFSDSAGDKVKKFRQIPPEKKKEPEETNLAKTMRLLSVELGDFFKTPKNYKIYEDNITFENKFNNTVTKTYKDYRLKQHMFRIYMNMRYVSPKLLILKITAHPEDNTVKVRWSIESRSFFIPTHKKVLYDGFSIFHVNEEGKIYYHLLDRMMPDEGNVVKVTVMSRLLSLIGAQGKASSSATCSVLQPAGG